MTAKCPLCQQQITPEQGPVVMGEDGFPEALSLVDGLGIPVVEPSSTNKLLVKLDGEMVGAAVAFDRKAGFVWRLQSDAAGNIMFRDGHILHERLSGRVEVGGDFTKPANDGGLAA